MIPNDKKELISRLYNFKFAEALQLANDIELEDRNVIEALSFTFGNCGWNNSNMDIIIHAAVSYICPQINKL